MRIVVLIHGTRIDQLCAAAAGGADGFLLGPEVTLDNLAQALHQLLGGQVPMPLALARRLLDDFESRLRIGDFSSQFTSREQEVLPLLVEGLSNKQIARRMNVSEHGAKRHVANILTKLGCSNRTMAVTRLLDRDIPGRRSRAE